MPIALPFDAPHGRGSASPNCALAAVTKLCRRYPSFALPLPIASLCLATLALPSQAPCAQPNRCQAVLCLAFTSQCIADALLRVADARPRFALTVPNFAQLRRALAPLHVAMPLLRNAPLCLADAPDAVLSPLCCSVALLNRASPMRREPKLRPSRAMHVLARPSLCGRSASEPWPNCPLRCRCEALHSTSSLRHCHALQSRRYA